MKSTLSSPFCFSHGVYHSNRNRVRIQHSRCAHFSGLEHFTSVHSLKCGHLLASSFDNFLWFGVLFLSFCFLISNTKNKRGNSSAFTPCSVIKTGAMGHVSTFTWHGCHLVPIYLKNNLYYGYNYSYSDYFITTLLSNYVK